MNSYFLVAGSAFGTKAKIKNYPLGFLILGGLLAALPPWAKAKIKNYPWGFLILGGLLAASALGPRQEIKNSCRFALIFGGCLTPLGCKNQETLGEFLIFGCLLAALPLGPRQKLRIAKGFLISLLAWWLPHPLGQSRKIKKSCRKS